MAMYSVITVINNHSLDLYLYPLLAMLRARGVGCHMAGMWMGGQLYCNDLALLARHGTAFYSVLPGRPFRVKDRSLKMEAEDGPYQDNPSTT